MAKKFLFLLFFTCFSAVPFSAARATDLGFCAGALFPYSQFQDLADTGFSVGYHAKVHAYEVFNYGMAINYGNVKGDYGVEFQEIDIYPFIDWMFYRRETVDFFTRGGIGLFHWESDGIWWLGSQGNGMITTFGVGCKTKSNFELTASITKLYADFDVDYFTVRLGYNFTIED